MEVHLRDLKNMGVFMTLKDIMHDILIRASHQRSTATVRLHALPEKESSTARDCNTT